jgi:hypothetical protein
MPTTKSKDLEKNIALLRSRLEPQRAGYTAAVFAELKRQFEHFRSQLEAAYFDMYILAPYSSRQSRFEYRRNDHLRAQCKRWTKPSKDAVPARTAWFDNPTVNQYYYRGGLNAPEPRYFRPQEEIDAELRKEADEITEHDFTSYASKLAGKIAKPITEATVEGQLWSHSFLRVSFKEDGVKCEQVWKTQMILNVSCLGKLFNQWPTRLVG